MLNYNSFPNKAYFHHFLQNVTRSVRDSWFEACVRQYIIIIIIIIMAI
jgi:hypothetical protein